MRRGSDPADLRGVSADVLVIGSGFAGLAAAIEAREAGASVIVLEKAKTPGGNSRISDGGMAAAGTDLQAKAGIRDSADLLCADMLAAGMGLSHPDLVRRVAERSNQTFRWLADDLGVEFLDRVDRFGGHSVPRNHAARGLTGFTIVKRQLAKLEQLGGEVRLRTRFQAFARDAQGRVRGVIARAAGDLDGEGDGGARIGARRAVVLAAGGFGSDIVFRSVHDPRLSSAVDTTNRKTATAEALKEALKLGAMPLHLCQIQLGAWASPDEKGFGTAPLFADYIAFPYGVVIDPQTGRRVVNELGHRKVVSDALLGIGHPCLGIADARALGRSGLDLRPALRRGVVKPFDTLGGLAAWYDVPADALDRAVQRFNVGVASGHDDEFGKPVVPGAGPLAHPPFYAVRLWPKVHYTMGGVQIDPQARVLDLEGRPIPGLYAAGEVTGGIHGACRLASCAITDCLVFGRIAGRNAARGRED